MRTTLTLDDDVLDKAKTMATELGRPFKRVVNEALRSGLQSLADSPQKTRSYRTIPHKMGLKSGRNLDNIQELLSQIEGEDRR
jgi:predicted transcriptional regulator